MGLGCESRPSATGSSRDEAAPRLCGECQCSASSPEPLAAADDFYRRFYDAYLAQRYDEAAIEAYASYVCAREAEAAEQAARGLLGVATAFFDLGHLTWATLAIAQAEEIDGTVESRGSLLAFHGLLLLEQDLAALAVPRLLEAIGSAPKAAGDHFFRGNHLNLVRAYLELGRLEEARHHWREAGRYATQELKVPSMAYFLAWIEQAQGNHEKAKRVLASALEDDGISEDWAWNLWYRLGISRRALGDLRGATDAFEAAAGAVEQLRSSLAHSRLRYWVQRERRAPLEALFRIYAERDEGLKALDILEQAKARAFLDSAMEAVAQLETPSGELPDLEPNRERVESLDLVRGVLRGGPDVAELASAQTLQRSLEKGVYYAFLHADGAYWRVVADAEQVNVAPVAVSAKDLEAWVDRYLENLNDRGVASELGEALLPPSVLPPEGNRIFIAPDGVLEQLPFAALVVGGDYVVNQYEVSYVPSLNASSFDQRAPSATADSKIVIGDPKGDLQESRREARLVAERMGVRAFVGEDANAQALQSAARAKLLHLSLHTRSGLGGPAIELSDGDVLAYLLPKSSVAPEVAFLASCSSGLQPRVGLWGSVGAAFLSAGSRAVVGSLWSIDVGAPADLVDLFYKHDGVEDPIAALTLAQRALLEKGLPMESWAPFVVLGRAH